MSLFDTIANLFRRTAAPTTTTDEREASLAGAAKAQATPTSMATKFSAERSRIEIVNACREMYSSDPRIKGVIKTLSRDAVSGGFEIHVDNHARAQESALALVARLRLVSRLDDWLRLTLRDGDSLLELGVDAARQIQLITRKPTLQMHRESDESDRFKDPSRAFWYAEQSWGTEPPSDAIWFAEWQIVHARWDHDEGSRYGTPLFAPANGPWKRVKEGEIDIAVRRKTRAGMKYLHVIEDGDEGDLEAHKENNADALDNPFAAVADFFSNKAGSIQAIQGDANLGQIEDVLHHIRTVFTASPVPMSLVGYGQDLNRDVLQEQKDEYEETLSTVQTWVTDDLLKPIFERQWLLDGILPEGLKYSITWKAKSRLTPESLSALVDAALKLKALGFPDEAVIAILSRFLPDIDLKTLLAGVALAGGNAVADQLAGDLGGLP